MVDSNQVVTDLLEALPTSRSAVDALTRRSMLTSCTQSLLLWSAFRTETGAAETVGKDETCNDRTCLGVWDGLLADCPSKKKSAMGPAGCVSSQDDAPSVFAEPWDYSDTTVPVVEKVNHKEKDGDDGNQEDQELAQRMLALKQAIQTVSAQHGDQVQVLRQQGRYLRVLFTDGSTGEESVGEFYFTLEDTTVQFRVASLAVTNNNNNLLSSSLSNRERCERIRKQLKYTKLIVLRNRQRSLWFVESDELDTFGPSGNTAEGLLPPAEMRRGDWEGQSQRQQLFREAKKDPKRYYQVDMNQKFPFSQ